MSILKIVKYPNPILKKVCELVVEADFDDAFQAFLDNMIETMYADNGMGLAANQVAVSKRIFVMDDSPKMDNPIILINPEIMELSEENIDDPEGCLSFPGIALKIKRPKDVRMKAQDRHGNEFIIERSGYSAKCLHHEFDHLRGIHFFDHLSALKRDIAEKKLQKYLDAMM